MAFLPEPKDDLLNRNEFAKVLVNFLDQCDSSVLALNGSFGSGKTFFVEKVLMPKLNNETSEYECIYLNAFENDYNSNPFIAIAKTLALKVKAFKAYSKFKKNFDKALSELAKEGTKQSPELFQKFILSMLFLFGFIDGVNTLETKGSNWALALALASSAILMILVLIFAFLSGYFNSKHCISIVEKQNSEHENNINNFKNALENIIKKNKNRKIIFIIDELDRCRPGFAVELLEKIKHIFSVEGVIFIISSNPEQLQSSIKHMYGEINAYEYLQKFFDLQFTLPSPAKSKSCTYDKYVNYYVNDVIFSSNEPDLSDFIITLAEKQRSSLRALQKMFFMLKYFYNSPKEYEYLYLSFVIFLKITDPQAFNKVFTEPSLVHLPSKNIYRPIDYMDYLISASDEGKNFKSATALKRHKDNQLVQDKKEFISERYDKIDDMTEEYFKAVEYLFEAISEKMNSSDSLTLEQKIESAEVTQIRD